MAQTIKMLRDFRISQDGFTVENWKEGEIHENVPDALVNDLLHPTAFAAVVVTGNAKVDEAAELKMMSEIEAQEHEAAARKALDDAAAQAALEAARTGSIPQVS